MNLEILTFILYVLTAASTTIIVGQQLYTNGAVFLERIFQSALHLVVPVNKMLLVGFYLVNLGFVLAFFTLKTTVVSSPLLAMEFVVGKLGTVYLLLGGMHFFNIGVFVLIEKKMNSKVIYK